MNPNEKQVAGSHYAGAYQHWDFVRLALQGRYLEGCATKYISRWRKKNGLQDLEKACHYVEKILDVNRAGRYPAPVEPDVSEAEMFCAAQELTEAERELCVGLCWWRDEHDLLVILTALNRLIAVTVARS